MSSHPACPRNGELDAALENELVFSFTKGIARLGIFNGYDKRPDGTINYIILIRYVNRHIIGGRNATVLLGLQILAVVGQFLPIGYFQICGNSPRRRLKFGGRDVPIEDVSE